METVFVNIATEYLLTEYEVEDTVDYISKNISGKDLMDMYASGDREYYAQMLILPYVERKVSHREHIKGVTAEKLQEGLRMVWENIADSAEYKGNINIEMA